MNDTNKTNTSQEESRIFYAGYADIEQAKQSGKDTTWKIYPATPEGYAQAIADEYTAISVFTFSHPVEEKKPQPIRYGDIVLDFDAKRIIKDEDGNVIGQEGDIFTAQMAMIVFVELLRKEYDVLPESLSYYASGGKGFHVCIPCELFGGEQGDISLNEIYRCMLKEITLPLYGFEYRKELIKDGRFANHAFGPLLELESNSFKDNNMYIDDNMFKGGKGQLLRMAHIKRADGKYKVPITYDEIVRENAAYFEELVLRDRQLAEETAPCIPRTDLKCVPKLEELFLECKSTRHLAVTKTTAPQIENAVKECAFVQYCIEHPQSVDEPQWFLLARLTTHMGLLGKELFHAWSRLDPRRYNRSECEAKLKSARKYKIVTCKEIQKQGYCKQDCNVKCPVNLYQKQHAANYDNGVFECTSDGLLYYPDPDDRTDCRKLASPIEVIALARDKDALLWSKYIKLTDPDGNVHYCTILYSDLNGSGEKALDALSHEGLCYEANKWSKDKLLNYLRSAMPSARVLFVGKNGWIGKTNKFFPFDMGKQSDGKYLHPLTPMSNMPFEQTGTLEEWQEHIAKPCMDNPLLQMAIITALAGPFLKGVEHQGFGVHFYGHSSSGKTTCLRVASSVTGGEMKAWRATDNGLEGIAEQFNDNCLLLDELGQCTSEAVSNVAYMLPNGQGKARATKLGDAREIRKWLLVFLSTGELTITDKINQNHRTTAMAGQEIRCISLLADGGTDQGVFSQVPEGISPSAFADQFVSDSKKYKGVALLDAIELVKQFQERAFFAIENHSKAFLEGLKKKMSSQVGRVASNFAFLAGVGEFCIEHKLLPWNQGDAQKAAKFCFEQWFKHNGTSGSFEIEQSAKKLEKLIMHNFYGEFSSFENTNKKNSPAFQYSRNGKTMWFITKRYCIDSGICKNYQYNDLVKYLDEKGLLVKDKNGNVQTQMHIDGVRPPRGFSYIKDNIYAEETTIEDAKLDTAVSKKLNNQEDVDVDF